MTNTTKGKEKKATTTVAFKLLVVFTLRKAANSCLLSGMPPALLWPHVAGVLVRGTCLLPPSVRFPVRCFLHMPRTTALQGTSSSLPP